MPGKIKPARNNKSLDWSLGPTEKEIELAVDKGARLENLKRRVQHCSRCPNLVYSRRLYPYGQPTFGFGNPNSRVAFVGEAPGKDGCGTTGIPFTRDRSGEYYQRVLREELGLKLEDVWTTNVVKCCPENNRTPDAIESRNCYPFLLEELQIVRPKLIVSLGKTATSAFRDVQGALSLVVGTLSTFNSPPWVDWSPNVYALWHPAYILRDPTRDSNFRSLFRDIGKYASLAPLRRGDGIVRTFANEELQQSGEGRGSLDHSQCCGSYRDWEAPPTYKRWEADHQRELEEEWKREHGD